MVLGRGACQSLTICLSAAVVVAAVSAAAVLVGRFRLEP
jgi:hypothetical protein